jgi:hypothetical protein
VARLAGCDPVLGFYWQYPAFVQAGWSARNLIFSDDVGLFGPASADRLSRHGLFGGTCFRRTLVAGTRAGYLFALCFDADLSRLRTVGQLVRHDRAGNKCLSCTIFTDHRTRRRHERGRLDRDF